MSDRAEAQRLDPPGGTESPARPDASDPVVRRLYETHGSSLLSYLMKITRGDRHRAEDIVRETLLRAWRHPEAREQGDDRLDDIASVEDSFEKVLDRGEVRAALRALPARQREVLIEVYFRERSVQEAAEFLGVRNGEHGRPAQRRELHNYVVDHPPCSSGSGNERVPMTIADPVNPGSSVLVVLVGRA